jgi:hypothetical protein
MMPRYILPLLRCGNLLLAGAIVWLATAPAQAQDRRVPSTRYYAAQALMYDGELRDAERAFQQEARGAIKTAQSSWIDSICYLTMLGEVYYHQGDNTKALDNYNKALQLFVGFSDWMIRVQFSPVIQPDHARIRRTIPWGASQRRFKLGRFPDSIPIHQGRLDNQGVVQQGGVVQQAMMMPINVYEVVRCTSLAIRRRRELMGPVCKHDPLTQQVLAKLTRRPAPPNHWSQAWIDVQLGLAYAAADENAQALQFLQRSIVAGGEWDHPLTCVALLELGRLAMQAGDLNAAGRQFAEAGYSAAYFENAAVLIEAMQLGQRAHLMSNGRGVYPPLAKAQRYGQINNLRLMQAWCAVLQAENYAALGLSQQASRSLADAVGAVGRRDMGAGVVGAYLNFHTALVAYQKNRPQEATQALASALAFERTGSKSVFRMALANRLYVNGAITPRVAMELYGLMLRDPRAEDWTADPLEALAVLVVPHGVAFENWFDAALKRKELETAVEVADRARRHRFFTSLPLGGRLLSLRRLLETSPDYLDKAPAIQRQDLLVRYPAYDELAQQGRAARQELAALPLVAAGGEAQSQSRALGDLGRVSSAQEGVLREMALRREPADMIFPPVMETKEIQKRLADGQAALVFFETRTGIHAFLLNKDQYAHWRLGPTEGVARSIVALLRELGNYDPNRELTHADLVSDKWPALAADVSSQIFASSKVNLAEGITELIVVPDGVLWYLPFEALPTKVVPDPPLITRMRVRYAPTLALGVPDRRPRKAAARTGVVVGKLFPRDDDSVAEEVLEDLRRSLPGTSGLPKMLPGPGEIYKSEIDRLIVLDDLAIEPAQPYGWTPIPSDKATAADLGAWFSLPSGGPDEIILPGYHTLAEFGLKQRSGAKPTGDEIFLSVCGMMSTGARTILLSRWRTGGQTAHELVREFAQELPHARAADAWQRSVELARERPLSSELEPRVKRFDQDAPAAAHPLFWAGYLLLDTGVAPPAPPVADEVAADEDPAQEQPPVIQIRPRNDP